MNVAYVVEIALFILVSIIEIIALRKSSGKRTALSIGLTIIIFALVGIGTFMFEKPTIDLKSLESIEVNSKISNPKTVYRFKDVTDTVKIIGDVDTSKKGEYQVKIEVPMFIGKYEKDVTVKVVDTKAPELVLKGESMQELSDVYEEEGYEAIDECDGDISEKVEIKKEEIGPAEYNLIYKVSDESGNSVEKKRHIKVVDKTGPVISLNGTTHIYLNIGDKYEEQGATAEDGVDGDVSDTVEVEGTVDTSSEGVTVVKYSAKDKSGNESTAERTVLVSQAGKVHKIDGSQGKKGVIYLTFDDGPTESSTPKILDILKKKGVNATFFVINYNDAGAELIKREHEEGNVVAIHCYSHTYSEIYQSDDVFIGYIEKLQSKINDTIGVAPTIFRFPGGSSNTISRHYSQGIMTRLCYEMVEKGYTYFDWNVDSDDAGSAKSSDDVYRNVTSHLSKDRANVVLMHDFANNNKTIGALEQIIDYGLQNGYTFEVLTPETQMVTHTTNN